MHVEGFEDHAKQVEHAFLPGTCKGTDRSISATGMSSIFIDSYLLFCREKYF